MTAHPDFERDVELHGSRMPSRRALLTYSALAAVGLLFSRGRAFGDSTPAKVKKQLKIHSQSPLNGEPELDALVKNRVTPVERFYVRNHGPIPEVQLDGFQLTIEGLVHKPLKLKARELAERFEQHKVAATLTCAGNRRSEMNAIKAISGVQWNAGAIGHALWEGPLLRDLLRAAELREGARHVWFEGLDSIEEKDGSSAPFGGSIPLQRLMVKNPGSRPLAALRMNGEALTAEHGFPLRMVVPGYIGARSVKWLGKITVSDRPSPNHYVAEAYKVITREDKDELAKKEPIYEFPVNAAICSPAAGTKLKAGKHMVAGYALPTGTEGCRIEKVEISIDGGQRWQKAEFWGEEKENDTSLALSWRLWSLSVDLTPDVKTLLVRATDSAGNTQPESTPWNLKGYLYNGWHKVNVEVS